MYIQHQSKLFAFCISTHSTSLDPLLTSNNCRVGFVFMYFFLNFLIIIRVQHRKSGNSATLFSTKKKCWWNVLLAIQHFTIAIQPISNVEFWIYLLTFFKHFLWNWVMLCTSQWDDTFFTIFFLHCLLLWKRDDQQTVIILNSAVIITHFVFSFT